MTDVQIELRPRSQFARSDQLPGARRQPAFGPPARKRLASKWIRIRCWTGNRLTVFTRRVKAVTMTSRISHTSFDAINAYAQSLFWSQVLDFVEDPDDPNEPGHEECLITSRDRSQLLLFITVPDDKKVKNRAHLDLRPVDRTREQEVERILALGASHLADHRRPDGSGWITLADPEGNEFCILSKDPASSGATT
jgi:Glyoxalase-like domain